MEEIFKNVVFITNGMEKVYDAIIIGASFEGLCLANYYALGGRKVE